MFHVLNLRRPPRGSFLALFPQRVKELEEEERAGSSDFVGPVAPTKVAELFLECPRMEQRFFGFRFESLSAEGLTLPFATLNKVFTTMATIQELPSKTRLAWNNAVILVLYGCWRCPLRCPDVRHSLFHLFDWMIGYGCIFWPA